MAKSFSNSVALNFISSAQQKEAQAEATENKTTAAKSAKPAKEENKTAAKAETPKKVKEPKTTAKTVKTETSAKTQKLVKPAKHLKIKKLQQNILPSTHNAPFIFQVGKYRIFFHYNIKSAKKIIFPHFL